MLTVGSLFSGIGGLDLGFERAGGYRLLYQVEIDQFCRKVLRRHWPKVLRHDDVRTFPPYPGDWYVDVLIGGFPCKQTSAAAAVHGKRTGLEGKDSSLWFEMLRIVQLVQPRWVVVENVSGASSYRQTIEGGLATAGYRLPEQPHSLSVEDAGGPHLRRRLFWTAHRHQPGLEKPWPPGPSTLAAPARRTTDGNPWLPSLAGVPRVDDGVPGRLDRKQRIIALGNAVAPAVAECVACWLKSVDQLFFSTTQGD